MKSLTAWFIDNPVAANLLMAFVLVAGVLSFGRLRVESFPQIPPSQLVISVAYPGGAASQVDQSITQRIEDAISGVPDIKTISSQSGPGYSQVRVRKNTGADLDRLMDSVRNRVEGIEGFPAQAERPNIYRDEFTNLAAYVLVYGGEDPALLQQIATRTQSALRRHPAISEVTNLGKRRAELVIEPDLQALQRHGLDLQELTARVNQWSLAFRSGELKTARGSIILRGDRYADSLPALQDLPILVTGNASVPLKQLAKVSRGYAETDSLVRFQGQQAIALVISTSAKDHLLRVSDACAQVLAELRPSLPQGVDVAVMADMAPYIEEQLGLLGTNAWQGLLIVVVVLGLFLEARLALWVAAGIPISLAGAMWMMGLPLFDYSINDITLFGMILVLGIVVDDAVVVGESIHQARRHCDDPKVAARKGVEAVALATVFGVLTTIAAFSPMLWIENELAKVLAGFSAVVIFALVFSLIESKFILPSHLCFPIAQPSTRPARGHRIGDLVARIRESCVDSLQRFNVHCYVPTLRFALAHRGAVLMLFASLFLISYGALFKGHIRAVFFPEIPGRYASLKVTMDNDAALALTQEHLAHLESAAADTATSLQEEFGLAANPIVQSLVAMDGAGELEYVAELSKEAVAAVPSERFLARWQAQVGELEGANAQRFTLAEEPGGGTVLSVSAPNRDLARHVAAQLKLKLAEQAGVNNVYDDGQAGKRQLRVVPNQRGIQLGIDQRRLATLIGGAFGELEVHRLLYSGEEVRVLIRLGSDQRRALEQLKATPVMLGKDSSVTLGEVAEFSYSREPEVLHRHNRDEVVRIYWRQQRSISSPEQVWARLQQQVVPELQRLYPEVRIRAIGEFEEIGEVQHGFKQAMALTVLLIYVLLAIPLRSYWQPLIVMSVIPFGFAGAILGHGIMGLPVSLLSLFGMMAMTGVVINDSLVLLTRFNQLLEDGWALKDALLEAGRSRMRAVFLTTITTVLGLLPLLLESSEQAQYLKPAAVSLVFGELLATPITLILIPILLSLRRYRRSTAPSGEPGDAGQTGRSRVAPASELA